ncbi:hypothetical protein BsWGS_15835 [Bradybaena similaris]
MSSGSSLVVPMVLWGRYAPTHCVSAILMTPDGKYIVTGCNDGQICVWDVLEHYKVAARNMLFGHTAAISCLAMGSEHRERCYIVSSSENGEMCLWDVSDGRCIENNKMDKVHSDIAAYHLKSAKALRLVCNGYYDEIVIIDPLNLEIVYSLVARVESDWISACCIITPPNRDDDVILAITNSGTVKVWTLTSPEPKGTKVPENESKQIRCLNAQTLRCCPGNLRTVLIVCSKYWQVYNFASRKTDKQEVIYDASDFTLLCSESNRRGERWMGGDFLGVDRVIVWSNEGRGYLYKLPTNANPEHSDYHKTYNQSSVHAYYVLDIFTDHKPLDCSPALTYVTYGGGEKANHLMLRGDSDGRVTVWVLPQVSEKQMTLVRQESFDRLPALSPKSNTTLQESWNVLSSPPSGILDGLFADSTEEKDVYVTATIYIPSQGRLVCGRSNGTIMIVSAIDCIKRQLLVLNKPVHITPMILSGHHGRVTCLLYPFNEATRYEPHHLLSGGTDFSVILWDVEKGSKIYVFTVHGGSLTQITVPPANCNPRILSCVCSVAGDHSVALLSLKERKCLLLASRHLYPVKMIKWRPLDDFMLVQTKDGVVTVWQMETGHLDRVIDGKTAEDVLSNCDENATPVEALTNPSITLAQALKRRNLATFRNLAQQKLNIHTQHNLPNQGNKADYMKPTGFPLLIQGVKTNTRDPDAHVLFFDTEALIVHLLTEEYAMLSPAELEARGMNITQSEKSVLQSEITDAQQKLADQSSVSSRSSTTVNVFDEGDYIVVPEDKEVELNPIVEDRDSSATQKKSRKTSGLSRLRKISSSSKGSYSPPSPSSVTSPFSPVSPTPPSLPSPTSEQSKKKGKLFSLKLPSKSKALKMKNYPEATPAPGDVQFQSAIRDVNGQSEQSKSATLYRALSVPALLNEKAATLPAKFRHESVHVGFPTPTQASLINWADQPMGMKRGRMTRSNSGLITKAKEKAETMSQKLQAKIDNVANAPIGSAQPSNPIQTQPASSQRRPESIAVHESLSMAIGELFMSCLHAWSLDPQLDDLCLNKLGLHKPKCPISFGLLSHRGHMSLMLPGWHRHQNLVGGAGRKSSISSVSSDTTPTLLHQRMGAVPFDSDILNDDGNDGVAGKPLDASLSSTGLSDQTNRSPKPARPPPARRTSSVVSYQQQAHDFSTKLRWQISSAVTTQHLLSVISVANTLMGMSRAVFLPELLQPLLRSRRESTGSNFGFDNVDSTGMSDMDSADTIATIQAQIKQGWSLLAALHCVLLPELVGPDHYQCPQLEMLARRWQDRCLEIREAAQALLLAELRRIKNDGRKKLLDKWAPFLPSYVDPELSLLSNAGAHKEGDEDEDDEEEGILAGDIPAHKLSVSFESRRKQATAIVMLGVIGAEFGQEMEPSRTKPGEEVKKTKGKGTVEGFSLTNYSLARHTSKALMFLLLQPPSAKLPAYTPIRRAAIDLIGRGFTVWEPYLDVSSVLLGLLELSIDSNKLIPSTTYGLPLSPAADACRTARHALSLIATARPPAFIITMAKEVARYNALAQNAQHPNAHLQNIILVRASAEILHIIELLVEKIPNDVADLIVEAMDVTMFCLDLAALKAKGLPELFPAICRFSMVAYCPNTKRVWVGARNGHLALYELKQHAKCQMISAHHGAVTAVSINQDGKYLATFSHVDNKLKFWQTASTSLFGIGSQQTKQIRSYSTPPISVSPVSNILKLVRLVWIDKAVVVLLTVDGQEQKYSV